VNSIDWATFLDYLPWLPTENQVAKLDIFLIRVCSWQRDASGCPVETHPEKASRAARRIIEGTKKRWRQNGLTERVHRSVLQRRAAPSA